MGDMVPDPLTDVAYGLLIHLISGRLRADGDSLFTRVERGPQFLTEFHETYTAFRRDYPDLCEALVKRFGGPDAIYTMILDGEGVVPSRTTQMYWVVQDAPDTRPDAIEDELAGKWLIFLPPDEVDKAWCRVRDATCEGLLGISAKVSTAKKNPEARDTWKVIYVYTPDWRDEEDVMRAREHLRALGFTYRIGYKRNIETFRGEYSEKGKRVTFYSA
ncbi:MAG: DUF1917 domain-containing protein [Methanomicrobiales archaeon]|nr:DUF1917 domain-containing protein [Methanomicrobiales archaeon]